MSGLHLVWKFVFKFPCIFRMLTGYYCPGCGGTRALRALLRGHFLQSVYYHPLVLYLAVLVIWWLARLVRCAFFGKEAGNFFRNWMAAAGILLVLVNWIGKNLVLYIWKIPLL